MFSRKQMIELLTPLVVRQIMTVLVGVADMVMVIAVGESAVSSVSLVDSISVLIVQIIGALAAGGAVISAQYLGKGQPGDARKAAGQLVLVTLLLPIIIAGTALTGGRRLLRGILGKVEQNVMDNAQTYLWITALSYPFTGLYDACAALLHSIGNSEISIMTSSVMDIISIIGNAICVFDLKMGVAGMVWPILISRVTAAFMTFILIQSRNNTIRLNSWKFLILDHHMVKNILSIRIPNGPENGMFQLGKIFLRSLVSFLDTVPITSFAVTSNLVTVLYLPGNAIGLGLMTIAGQCIGAGRPKEAKSDTKSLIMVVYGILAVLSAAVVIWPDPLVGIYHLSPQTALMARELILTHSITMIIWPLAFTIPHALRASLDAKFTTTVSVFSMWVLRTGSTYLFIYIFDLRLSGVQYGMFIDWVFRVLMFSGRLKGFERRAGVVE